MAANPNDDDNKNFDINELIAKHSNDATQFIASTETIEELVKQGLRFDKQKPITTEEYIEKLFAERKERAKSTISQLPNPPQIALPPINSLYAEIRECILFGLNGAAITLSAVLVEFAIKHAIIDHTKGVEVYDKKEWDRIEGKELGKVINEAEQHGLFKADEIKRLKNFKDMVRNPYLHYNIKKITTGAIMPEAFAYETSSKQVVKKYNLKAEDNPFLWQLAKKHIDEQEVLPIFGFADSVVKRLFGSWIIYWLIKGKPLLYMYYILTM